MKGQWRRNMKLIDANVMLRFLLNDNKEQAEIALLTIKEGACTRAEVMAEVVYVLKNVYGMSRDKIYDCLSTIIKVVKIEDKDAFQEALEVYKDTTLDFVDCILIGRNHILGEDIFSFDKKLNNKLK